jgi:hypothetical protein
MGGGRRRKHNLAEDGFFNGAGKQPGVLGDGTGRIAFGLAIDGDASAPGR